MEQQSLIDLTDWTDQPRRRHVSALLSSESAEWYTPPKFIETAREVLGEIDLDPASCDWANENIVKAKFYYTKETDGLAHRWTIPGTMQPARVWLNCPYGLDEDSNASNQFIWTSALIEEYRWKHVSAAISLVNAAIGDKWFNPLYRFPLCLCYERIRFINRDGKKAQPTKGNAFFYLGREPEKFQARFREFGRVILPE